MKLTVLGNRSPYPIEGSGCSGYLLQTKQQNILIDVGEGVLERLNGIIDYHKLDAIIISHLHADHFLGLIPLQYAIMVAQKSGLREKPLDVYLPFETGAELSYIQAKLGTEYNLEEINENKKLELGALEINFQKTIHFKECYGMMISNGEQVLGYTADTAWSEDLIPFFSKTDLLLIEATLLEENIKAEQAGHMTVKQAVNFGIEANSKRMLLTHLRSTRQEEEIVAEIPETNINVEVSQVNKTYIID
ncbi:metal-dependent hydrolase, beta-lactamase superfamily III [Halobacteroides halobius DSM 5150]|uniref:Metal-dependent hydrolase, beta-lactamase superfamily III n=1 Tax=Halobacteroides halobius (strain ATCC 35273 / DSM 5150 / MD-1) TaxID=748449 RepID=L0KAP2_HALHC|nr:MBL fold metallo-hydrolase [Halobacteroides halobius]AGB41615.1 metal-dependent hydrolase, beta-lactamase superfamily III [Halobacteroides halobius DSM 5150]